MNNETANTERCPDCGAPMMGARQWARLPTPRRVRRRLRGTCEPCATRRPRPPGEPQAATVGVPRELVLLDWQWLHETGELFAGDPLAHRVRLAAPRIGMSVDALAKALERAGIRNPAVPAGTHRTSRECTQCRVRASAVSLAERDLGHAARRAASLPDSSRARRTLDEAQRRLAEQVAARDAHVAYEHAEAA